MSWPDPASLYDITDHQRAELNRAFKAKMCILTGCPGSGKTFTLARVLDKILARAGKSKVRVCSYTGKAAVRATESLKANNVNLEATTIHKLLGVSMDKKKGNFTFVHNRHNKLPIDYCIVDEVSMLGNGMANHLLQALPDDCFLLLIGDHHQLPPVEPGAVLRDMLAAGIPHGDLREIFRNSGQIVACCKEIREGRLFAPSAHADYYGSPDDNLCHMETPDNNVSLAKIKSTYADIQGLDDVDPKWSVQVLSFINEGSPLARKELNATLQQQLNPNGHAVIGQFLLGDKVICLKNKLYVWEDKGDQGSEFVANGQMGEIVGATAGCVEVLMKSSPQDPGTRVVVSKSDLRDQWDLGYAISVHKSQGSSWKIVMVAIDQSARARFMASRQLIYTALSRAEKYCVTIGTRKAINEACRKDAMATRITGLEKLLKEELFHEGRPIWA